MDAFIYKLKHVIVYKDCILILQYFILLYCLIRNECICENMFSYPSFEWANFRKSGFAVRQLNEIHLTIDNLLFRLVEFRMFVI